MVTARRFEQYAGSPGAALLVWVACGLISLAGGLCYAELGAALPFTGGETVYLERAFGRTVAFLYVWTSALLARPASLALSAIIFAEYIGRLRWDGGERGSAMTMEGIACAAIGCLCLLQLLSTWFSAKLISTLTIGKLILVAAIGLIGLIDFGINGNDTGQLAHNSSFVGTSHNPGNWVLAFTNCLFSFNGWNSLNLAAGEVRQPAKTIPIAIPTGLIIVTLSYVWINISYFTAIPLDEIKGSETLAVDFAAKVVGETFSKAITFLVAMSAIATCNGTLFAGAQAVRESGRSRILPKIFASELQLCGETPTPAAALLIQCSMAAVLVLLLESFEVLVRIYVWTQWCFYALTIMALVKLRWSEPGLERPFSVWIIVPVVFVAASVFTVIVLLFITPATCAIAIGVLILGLPVYGCHMRMLRKSGVMWSFSDRDSSSMQPLLVEEYGDRDQDKEENSKLL